MAILSQVNLLHETESIGRALVARVEGHSEGCKLVFMSTTNRGDVDNVSLNEAMALLRSKRSGCREAPKKRSELGISNAHLGGQGSPKESFSSDEKQRSSSEPCAL